MNEILRAIEAEQMRNDLPNFNVGDNVKLHVKVKEGNRERIQMFEGTVMNEILRAIEAEQMRNDLPNFNVGDNVKLHVKVKEGNRERIQMFEGTVIKRQTGGLRETFTVRRVAYGVGVERTFPVNSPIIEKMEVTRRGKVRRAKLF